LLQEEGWLMGVKEGSGEKGMFPANFTRPLWVVEDDNQKHQLSEIGQSDEYAVKWLTEQTAVK
jgi:hypothetical protein